MPYQLTKRVQHRVHIAGQLDAEQVDAARQGVVRSLKKQVNLPGFRPGKVPTSLIASRYAEEIRGELLETLSNKLLREILDTEEEFFPISSPEVSSAEIAEDGSFTLEAELEVRPIIELMSVKDLTLPEIPVDVADSEVDEELEKLRKEQATWEPADEEPAADGMRVDCSFRGTFEEDDEEFVNEESAGFVIGADELYAEINEAMQGAKTGDTRVATRAFAEDDPDEARAGKTARFEITVKSLKREVLPEVDDELAKNVGLEGLDQLRERILEMLTRNKVAERRTSWRRHLLDQLGGGFDLNELPRTLVQASVSQELARFEQLFANQGGAPQGFDRQELATKVEPQARRQVLDMLILEQLAQDWQIDAEDEVDRIVSAEAAHHGVPPAEYKANLAKQDRLDGLRTSARLAAAADELIRRAGGEVEP